MVVKVGHSYIIHTLFLQPYIRLLYIFSKSEDAENYRQREIIKRTAKKVEISCFYYHVRVI